MHSGFPCGVLILLKLCVFLADFHTFALQLHMQTSVSMVPALQDFVSSLEKCQTFNKKGQPLCMSAPNCN